jgi:lysyl endopeptidase
VKGPSSKPERRAAVVAAFVTLTLAVHGPASGGDARARASVRHFGLAPPAAVDRWTAPAVDVERLLREDERNRDRPGVPLRVGHPVKADLSPADRGTWEALPGRARLWRMRLESAGALWIVVGLETFRPEPGARLFAYDPAGSTVRGPYTSDDVRDHGQLWLAPIEGATVILELEWPASVVEPNVRVGTVSHGYKAWGGFGEVDGGPATADPVASAAGACNVDVNCPAGDDWQDQKRGVVQLLSGGFAFCTGSLINNAANDCRPLVLTAAHCGAGPSTIFRFNYERPGCENGSPPGDQTLTGASVLASYAVSDFSLLELDEDPPERFAAFFNGWRRSPVGTLGSWGIHHPSGDVKKISRDDDLLLNGRYWGSHHWRVNEWDMGSTEAGSSGSPLFDPGGRIIGQLHGGTASCSSDGWDEYGKLYASWSGGGSPTTRLSDWLDPSGTGASVLEGIDAAACRAPRPELSYAGYVVDDTLGNANGVIDPGETVALRVRVANEGTLAATGVVGSLSAASAWVTIMTTGAEWAGIDPDSEELSDLPSFLFHVDAGWSCGVPIGFALDLTAAESPEGWGLEFSLPTGVADATELFFENVEGPIEGWTIETPSGASGWVTTDARSSSPTRSWHVANPAEPAETLLRMPPLSSVPEGAVLRFEHFMNAEESYDGGVLEYSTDGATWLDAGPLIVEGAYNGSIHLSQATPLSGRQAWTGELEGWHTVVADLSPFAGSDVSVRWRFASDASVGDEGWYVDDIMAVVEWTECAPGAPGPPGEPSAPGGAAPPLVVGRVEGGLELTWGAPESGGPVTDYVLYSVPIAAPTSAPVCEASLGSGTQAILDALPEARAFLVVARNASGEGSYGSRSDGTPRVRAGGDACASAPLQNRPPGSDSRTRLTDRTLGDRQRLGR